MAEVRVRKVLANLLLMGVAVALISFFVAPAVAFFGIRSAADARDAAGLQRLVDYDALRRSLRPQLVGRAADTAPPPDFLDDPIGAIRSRFAQSRPPAVRPPEPDAYLSPAAISALTRGEGRYASVSGTSAAPRDPWPRPTYWGFNRARFVVLDEGGSRTVFTFERRGPFAWTLVHVGLPEGATPAASAFRSEAPATRR